MYVTEDKAYWADSAKVQVKGTVGAGDSMVAGFAIGRINNLDHPDSFKTAMAIAAGSVSLEGTEMCNKQLYEQMIDLVTVEELE